MKLTEQKLREIIREELTHVNEAKFFRLPSDLNAIGNLKNSVDFLVNRYETGQDYKPETMRTIEEFIKEIKKASKSFKSKDDVEGTLYETITPDLSLGKGPSEATFQSVVDGKRDIGYEAIINGSPYVNDHWEPMIQQIKNAGLKILDLKRKGGEAIIYYRDNANGRKSSKKLAKIANNHDTFLDDKTTKEAREIGELLGYHTKDIEEYIRRRYNHN